MALSAPALGRCPAYNPVRSRDGRAWSASALERAETGCRLFQRRRLIVVRFLALRRDIGARNRSPEGTRDLVRCRVLRACIVRLTHAVLLGWEPAGADPHQLNAASQHWYVIASWGALRYRSGAGEGEIESMSAGQFIQAPELSSHPAIRHAFFTRQGGVSGGLYASLNGGLGSAMPGGGRRESQPDVRALGLPTAGW